MIRPLVTARAALVALLTAILIAAGCGSTKSTATSATSAAGNPSAFPMTIAVDGTTLTFNSPPKVLVDQYEATWPVAAAGGNTTGKVVAVTDDANQPLGDAAATLDGVPRISTYAIVSKEVIIGAKPNLVITHGLSTGQAEQLDAVGIKTMVVNVCWDDYASHHGGHVGFDAIYDDITTIGRVLGTSDYAAKSVASLKQTVATVSEQAKTLPKQTVSITAGLFSGSFFTYGASSIANTQITTLGLTNTFADVAKRGFSASPEEFINRNPDFVVLGYDPVTGNADKTMQQAMAVPGFSTMRAVQNHHLLVMSDTFLLGRAVDGLKMIYDAIAAAK